MSVITHPCWGTIGNGVEADGNQAKGLRLDGLHLKTSVEILWMQ